MIYIEDSEFKTLNDTIIEIKQRSYKNGLYIINGENGVGKSSFFHALYHGNINYQINDERFDSNIRNNLISYAPQHHILLEQLSVVSNIKISGADCDRVNNILKQLDGQYLFDENNNFGKLSGGEKQKVKIAIALSSDCPLILLDEIDSNLDNESVELLYPMLIEAAKSKVVFIVSHNYDLYLNIANGIVTIEDNKLSYEQLLNAETVQVSDNADGRVSDRELSELKPLSIYFRKLFVIFVLVAVLFAFVFNTTTKELSRLTYSTEVYSKKYTNNSVIILPPINDPFFTVIGDQSWLKKTPLLLDQAFYDQIKSLDYVKAIMPIQNVTSFSTYSTYLNGDKQYALKNDSITIDPDNLNSDVSKLAKDNGIILTTNYQLFFQQMSLQAQVATNTPYTAGFDILAGNYPVDNTNQVMVPLEVAEYLIKRDNLASAKQLIGTSVTVALNEVDGLTVIGSDSQTFEISGIFIDYSSTDSTIVYSYQDDSLVTKSNNCSTGNELELEACAQTTGLETYSESQFRKLVQNDQIGKYSGLYVETKTEQDIKQLTNFVRGYDGHIFVDNDYTRTKEVVNGSSRNKILEVVQQYGLILIIYFVSIWVLYQYQLNQLKPVQVLLQHINFPKELTTKYFVKKMRVIPLIGIGMLIATYAKAVLRLYNDLVEYGFYNKPYLLIMTIIYVVMIGLLIVYHTLLVKLMVKRGNDEN